MKITNKLRLPQAFIKMAESDYEYKDKQYSVTSLLRGIRETILKRRYHHQIESDVSDMIWMLWGQAVHHILEQQPEKDCELKEEYLRVAIKDGYYLSGIFDLYNAKEKRITDYKTCSTWKIIYNDFQDWRKQLLIYAWMMKISTFDVKEGEIIALLKDHSKTKAKYDSTYPQQPVIRKQFKFTSDDLANIQRFIMGRFRRLIDCENLPDNQLPVCTAEERWAKPDKYAVKKKGRKSALRVLDTEEEAEKWMEKTGKGESIEYRQGKDEKCENYCSVNCFCDYYQNIDKS